MSYLSGRCLLFFAKQTICAMPWRRRLTDGLHKVGQQSISELPLRRFFCYILIMMAFLNILEFPSSLGLWTPMKGTVIICKLWRKFVKLFSCPMAGEVCVRNYFNGQCWAKMHPGHQLVCVSIHSPGHFLRKMQKLDSFLWCCWMDPSWCEACSG